MKARVKWIENACLFGETGSGHGLVLDGAPEIGGRDLGPRPMEMVLLGLGGCAAMDVIHILNKSRQAVTGIEILLDAERAETDPKVFTKIDLEFVITGHDLSEKHVARAVELSAEKYCSVSHMLNKTAEITHRHHLVPATVA